MSTSRIDFVKRAVNSQPNVFRDSQKVSQYEEETQEICSQETDINLLYGLQIYNNVFKTMS